MTKLRKLAIAALLATAASGAMAQDPLDIVFTVHSGASNTFWQAVQKGYEDACAKIGATCQMVYVQTDGSIPEQVANMEAALARSPDALITSIVDNTAFDDVIQRARDAGVIVIASNVDDLEGAAGNARQAFIGQGFEPAGYGLARAQWANLPAEGPIHVLVGVSGPGQNWSETRALGITNYIDEMIAANPDRGITYEKIDSGLDLAVVADRVGAYLSANPNTNAYFDTGFWHAGVAGVLRDRGVPPGQVLLAGFDLVPIVLDEMEAGYIQVQVDQQPFMQGFMPVMEIYQSKTVGLAPVDINTGEALVYPADVPAIREMSEMGLR
ncbi:MAG: sugar ABC transporter substrate-binding protein [Rhodobacterales bacterium]|jgi:simple sugar transport system substrate-binding protein|nr:sugar ABC transporter substrate-binding protein [Rhodobacterales bacterium]